MGSEEEPLGEHERSGRRKSLAKSPASIERRDVILHGPGYMNARSMKSEEGSRKKLEVERRWKERYEEYRLSKERENRQQKDMKGRETDYSNTSNLI